MGRRLHVVSANMGCALHTVQLQCMFRAWKHLVDVYCPLAAVLYSSRSQLPPVFHVDCRSSSELLPVASGSETQKISGYTMYS